MYMRFPCFIFSVLCLLTSCYKSNETSLTVKVRNVSGASVVGASVKVRGNPPQNASGNVIALEYEEATNSNGISFFNMRDVYKPGQSGVAIVEIVVQKGSLIAEHNMELLEEINNQIDFVLQ